MNASALLHLLQFSSPSLPIGAYSYSQGLEAALEGGLVALGDGLGALALDLLLTGPGDEQAVAQRRAGAAQAAESVAGRGAQEALADREGDVEVETGGDLDLGGVQPGRPVVGERADAVGPVALGVEEDEAPIEPGLRWLRCAPCEAETPLKLWRFMTPAVPLPLLVPTTSTSWPASKVASTVSSWPSV